MPRALRIVAVVAASLLALGMLSRIEPPGYTRIDLTGDAPGRNILSIVVPDGERITLTWRNSQFGLEVTEVFFARSGVLVQDQITFSAPDGTPPPRVSPRDVDDLYQTGGAFDARGLSRPFRRIVYRIGEIGDPRFTVRNKTVAFKQTAGFGGRLVLTATRPALHEILWLRAPPNGKGVPGDSRRLSYIIPPLPMCGGSMGQSTGPWKSPPPPCP